MDSLKFGSPEFQKSFSVLLWTMSSAVVVFAIDAINMIEVTGDNAVVIMALVNTLLYALKQFIMDNRAK